MTNKRYAKIKTLIYENYKFIIFMVVASFLFLYQIPVVINMPGGLLPTTDRVEVEGSNKSASGSLNMAYVSELQATPATYLLSFLREDWKTEPISDIKYDHETLVEATKRSQILLKQANQNATINAFNYAKKDYELKNAQFHVAYIDDHVTAKIKIGDIITKINDQEITSYEYILKKVQEHSVGDVLTLTVLRDSKELNIEAPIIELEGEPRLGILIIPLYEIETTPNVIFTYKKSESGSSGGLMVSLEIYQKITNKDITHGKTIVGTGTIDAAGNVGEIAGIEFKLRGAVKEKADIFLAPAGENYKEAVKLKEKYNFPIEIVEIKTFEDALNYLDTLEN